MDRRLSAMIAVVITIAWTTSFILSAINTNYQPPPTIHALMMLVAGAAFGTAVLRRNGNSNGK